MSSAFDKAGIFVARLSCVVGYLAKYRRRIKLAGPCSNVNIRCNLWTACAGTRMRASIFLLIEVWSSNVQRVRLLVNLAG